MKTWTLIIALVVALWMTKSAEAQEISRSNAASSARGYRAHIRSMHILGRPNRPGHFYGNTVRRRYYSRNSQGLRLRRR